MLLRNPLLPLCVALLVALSTVRVAAQIPKNTCMPGTYRDGKECSRCPKNSYSAIANATVCTPCPPRQVSKRGSRAVELCRVCDRGERFDGEDCVQCRRGTYNDKKDSDVCMPCPEGYLSGRGSESKKSCTLCPDDSSGFVAIDFEFFPPFDFVYCRRCINGLFSSPDVKPNVCVPCPKGHFRNNRSQRKTGRSGCEPCRPGTFADEKGSMACKFCPKGFYQNELGATKCKKCPPKSTTAATGKEQCRPTCLPLSPGCPACPPGEGLNPGNGKCEVCPKGHISSTFSTTPCYPCPTGEGFANAARTKCVCKPGFMLRLDGLCEKCESGYSTEDSRRCMCVLNDRITGDCICPPLTREKNNTCVPCDPKRDFRCNTCDRGNEFNEERRRCEKCPANTFGSDGFKCKPCPLGAVSTPGTWDFERCFCKAGSGLRQGACQPCPAGKFYADEKKRDSKCRKCELNTFSDKPGSTKCKKCPDGTGTKDEGATECSPTT